LKVKSSRRLAMKSCFKSNTKEMIGKRTSYKDMAMDMVRTHLEALRDSFLQQEINKPFPSAPSGGFVWDFDSRDAQAVMA